MFYFMQYILTLPRIYKATFVIPLTKALLWPAKINVIEILAASVV